MEKIINSILKQKIIDKSLELGFIDVKFADYQLLENEIKHFENWLSNNYHADMYWIEKNIDKRKNVRLIFENTQSIIVFAHSYFTDIKHNNTELKISRYAWGKDYHDILANKINEIQNLIKSLESSFECKSYVDTGPTMDKIWATKAGIGWQGKNSLIINPKYGSYFFISLVFSNLKFENDIPIMDKCGSCKKCIQYCPTQAILKDKVIDANKCISYWTIEAKPHLDIPQIIRNNLNGWAFGCDICQEVCPWNKNNPKITNEINFLPNNYETNFNFEYIKNAKTQEFNRKYNNTPIRRTKLSGIKRNLNIKEE